MSEMKNAGRKCAVLRPLLRREKHLEIMPRRTFKDLKTDIA
jgi:hypothetical protein